MYCKRAFFIKALKYRRFGNDIVQSVSVIFHGAFRWLFFTIKNHLCADDYAATVCAIKSPQLKQDRTTCCIFFNTKKVSVAVRQTIRACVIRKATFGTRKRFHNKQYSPKSKDQPFESERTHFDIEFNNGNIAMQRPTIILFFLTKSQPFNKKPKQNYIKQSQQTTHTTTQSKTHSKQNITNTKNYLINQT